ncbi:hypothetical protein [Desulfofalx alkaliphila]|uniref:hypothetical protein n=1 Tax=Desulfofalx alkaliphila TaxID=105483 RepID=UPI001EE4C421|nr:hypothetical protein [Desulfofalx alkaliphila]
MYVLGAGASAGYQNSYIGETSPVAKNFFQKACRVINIHRVKDRHFADENYTYNNLFSFIKKYWGGNVVDICSAHAEVDMEEVLTLLHIELEEQPHSETLKKACQEYMLLMALTFDKILYGDPCPYHQKIAASLSPGDVIISFNYELLMDNALLSENNWSPKDGYGVECHLLSNENLLIQQPSRVQLLKLHGSLNWLYCNKCHQLFTALEYHNKVLRLVFNHSEKVACTHMNCRHPLQQIIIPPTMMKNYHTMPFTQKLWRRAMKALADADYVVVMGYSFPPSDFRTKWLFRKAMAMPCVKPKKVTLVNHATGEMLNSLLKMYRALMRTDDINSYATIADFTKTL